MNKYYLKLLHYLCKKELKKISLKYPNSLNELIQWHDFMAIECIGNKSRNKLMGICVQTAEILDKSSRETAECVLRVMTVHNSN